MRSKAKRQITPEQQKKLTFAIAIMAIAFCTVGFFLHQQSDPDIWFHLACGEEITKQHSVDIGPFGSWYAQEQGYSDFLHEWLFEVLIDRVYQAFGAYALIGYTLLTGAALMVLILKVYWSRVKDDPGRTGIYLLLLILGLAPFYSARPQTIQYFMFTLSYMMATGGIGANWSFRRQCAMWSILSVVWANLHGGSWVLLLFFMAFMFVQAAPLQDIGRLRFKHNGNRAYAKLVLILAAVVTAAGMINPHGYQLITHTFHYMFTDSGTQYISEWQAMTFDDQQGYILIMLIFASTVQMIGCEEKIDFIDCEIIFSFFLETLLHVRNYPLLMIALTLWLIRRPSFPWMQTNKEVQKFILPGIMLGLGVYGGYTGVTAMQDIAEDPIDPDSIISAEIIDAIRDSGCKRLYNIYHYGDYLLYEGIDTFVDGRAQDMFTSEDVHDSAYIGKGSTKGDELRAKYDFDGYLVQNDSGLYYNLSHGEYRKVAEDENASFWMPITD